MILKSILLKKLIINQKDIYHNNKSERYLSVILFNIKKYKKLYQNFKKENEALKNENEELNNKIQDMKDELDIMKEEIEIKRMKINLKN